MFTIRDFCCLCLQTKKNLFNITINSNFVNNELLRAALKGKRNDNLYERLKLIVPEKVLKESLLENQSLICNDCYMFVNEIYNFREICMKNIRLYKTYVDKLKENNNVNATLSVSLPRCDLNFDPTDFLDFKIVMDSDVEDEGTKSYDFVKKEFREEEMAMQMAQEVDAPFVCLLCYRGYDNEDAFFEHQNTHMKKGSYECNICGMTFWKKHNLTRHVFTHTGKRLYSCEICKKQFSRKSNLNCHKTIHTGVKPYECETCKKTFRTISILNIHTRTHTGERPYACDFCDKAYAHKESLRQHRKIHTGEKHVCSICGKSFLEFCRLRRHREVHRMECKKCTEYYFENEQHHCPVVVKKVVVAPEENEDINQPNDHVYDDDVVIVKEEIDL